jgi:hypothetical protein
MTLKLISDNTIELQVYNFQDIVACARKYADQLEAGEQGEPIRAILITEHGDGIALSVWGDSLNGYEMIGILEAAKFRAYEANVSDEE